MKDYCGSCFIVAEHHSNAVLRSICKGNSRGALNVADDEAFGAYWTRGGFHAIRVGLRAGFGALLSLDLLEDVLVAVLPPQSPDCRNTSPNVRMGPSQVAKFSSSLTQTKLDCSDDPKS